MYSGKFDYDVIIVGAGLSGLAAAHAIHEKDSNISFLVLEGNDRIGGRLKSTSLNVNGKRKSPFDSGGQFLTASQTHLIRLLEKLNIEIHENTNDVGYTLGDLSGSNFYKTSTVPPVFGETSTVQDIMRFLGMLESMCSKVSLENPLSIDGYNELDSTTMEAFMYSNLNYSLSRIYAGILVKIICGADPSDISVLFFLAYCNSTEGLTNTYLRSKTGGKGCWIQQTAMDICEKLIATIGTNNVKTNNAVEAISRNDLYVLVRTAEHEYKCQYVIITTPPAQLLKINFYPPLNDAKSTVFRRMRNKPCIKFIITYEKEFWRDMDYNGDVYCYRRPRELFPILVLYNISIRDVAALTGILDVDYHGLKRCYKNEVLTHLALYFGKEALQPLDYTEKNWSDDEHIFEGYGISFPPPKMMKLFHEIRRPLGRLHFAGAETATYWYGHLAGAAQSGLRAGIEVLYEIRPQCLTAQDFIDLKPRRTQLQFYAAEENVLHNDWTVVLFIASIISYLMLKIFTVLQHTMRMFGRRNV